MAIVRAQVTFQGGSNLPEDRYINTLHFANDAPYATHATNIHAALTTFWTVAPPGRNIVGSSISAYVQRLVTVRYYDMSTGEPRVPTPLTFTLPTAAGTSNVPFEVAVVGSFKGAPPVTARRRGRIFIGPITTGPISPATSALPCSVDPGFRQDVTGSMKRLAEAPAVDWCIYSPTTGEYVPIVGGWVDDAFDTQRRRGNDATARTTWVKV